ncbi:transketolase family protein, partial [Streptococcus agalactiae]
GTHMPFEELGLLRLIPKATIFEVSDDIQFEAILKQTLSIDGLKYIRTIRKAPTAVYEGREDFSKGFIQLRQGKDITLVASGIMVSRAIEAADYLKELGIEASVIDLFKIKPLPEELKPLLIDQSIVTIENHNRIGGIGSALCEWLSMEKDTTVSRMGIDERFGQVGQMEYLLEEYGLAVKDIVQHCKSIYKS